MSMRHDKYFCVFFFEYLESWTSVHKKKKKKSIVTFAEEKLHSESRLSCCWEKRSKQSYEIMERSRRKCKYPSIQNVSFPPLPTSRAAWRGVKHPEKISELWVTFSLQSCGVFLIQNAGSHFLSHIYTHTHTWTLYIIERNTLDAYYLFLGKQMA